MLGSKETAWLLLIASLELLAVLMVTTIAIPITAAIIIKKTGLSEIKFMDIGRTG